MQINIHKYVVKIFLSKGNIVFLSYIMLFADNPIFVKNEIRNNKIFFSLNNKNLFDEFNKLSS